jgi:hypothetical protein
LTSCLASKVDRIHHFAGDREAGRRATASFRRRRAPWLSR